MSRLLARLCVLALVGAGGCNPGIIGGGVVPPCSDPRYTNGEYDVGATLDLSLWVLIAAWGPPVDLNVLRPPAQSEPYFTYSIGMTSGPLGFSVRADGRIAVVTETGFLGLAQLPAPGAPDDLVELQPTTVQQLHAAAAAWSNDGQRLAVIRWADDGGLQLLVLDEEPAVLSETAIELKQADSDITPYVVSWSPDNTQLALSTHIFSVNYAVNADCLLVDLASGAQHRLPFANVHFVDADLIVGTEQNVERTGMYIFDQPNLGPVYQMRLENGEVVSRTLVPGAVFVHASDPLRHTFLTAEFVRCWHNPYEGTFPAVDERLRDTHGHFSTLLTELYGWAWEPLALLPAETVDQWPAAEP